MAELSLKRQAFIMEYLKDFNATRAAIATGYSKRTASQVAHNILKDPTVRAAIQELMSTRYMGAEEVLGRLANIARGDMGDYVEVKNGEVTVKNWDKIVEEGKSSVVKKLENTKDGVRIELYDAKDALQWIGKYHALFTDVTLKVEKELENALNLLEANLDKETFSRILQILSMAAERNVKVIENPSARNSSLAGASNLETYKKDIKTLAMGDIE